MDHGERRGRVFIRHCGRATGDWRTGSRNPDEAYLMVGVIEVGDDDPWAREAVHGFASLGHGNGMSLSFEGAPRPIEDRCGTIDLPAALAHDTEFQRPGEMHMALGWGGGGMVLRDTRAPSAPGTSLALLGMVACLPSASLPDAHMADVTVAADQRDGTPRSARLTVTGSCPIETRGRAICQVAKDPLWGWGDEPHGFASLMRLDVVDACTRLQRLALDGGDAEEMERLRRFTQGAVQTTDPVFMEFLRLLDAKDMVRPWDDTPTASQILVRRTAVDALVRSLRKAA